LRLLKTLAHGMESIITHVSRASNVIGIISVGILTLLITSDVLGRFLFNHPITGTIEISQYVMILAVYCSVAYCAMEEGHVSVNLVVSRLPQRIQGIIDFVTILVSLPALSLIVWASAEKLAFSWIRDEASVSLGIPVWPFRGILIFGMVMLCLVLLVKLVHLVASGVKK